jgi:hypothetical protein
MREPSESDPSFWIENVDEEGAPIEAELLEAARCTWRRVLAYAQRQGQDASRTAEIFESVVRLLSKALRRRSGLGGEIRRPDEYLFRAFTRRFNRLLAKEPKITYVGSTDALESLAGARDEDWVSTLENEVLLKETISYMNKRTRRMFFQRQCGYRWYEIAPRLGMTVNNAQVQFGCDLRKIQERILRRKVNKLSSSERGSK